MKNVFKILFLILILVSCKKETETKSEFVKSDFNLITDITDFKNKMNELDTIKMWFDHSVCVYEAYERIEITKSSDSIKIRTEFKEVTFNENPEWETVYERKIPLSDTIWKMEDFLKKNNSRLNSDEKKYGTLEISHNETKLEYITNDLVDLNRFMADYFDTMRSLYPENKNNIYGFEDSDIIFLDDDEI